MIIERQNKLLKTSYFVVFYPAWVAEQMLPNRVVCNESCVSYAYFKCFFRFLAKYLLARFLHFPQPLVILVFCLTSLNVVAPFAMTFFISDLVTFLQEQITLLIITPRKVRYTSYRPFPDLTGKDLWSHCQKAPFYV